MFRRSSMESVFSQSLALQNFQLRLFHIHHYSVLSTANGTIASYRIFYLAWQADIYRHCTAVARQ